LTEYRQLYPDFKNAGIELAVISVDAASRAAPMKEELGLPFAVLCDTRREVVTKWGLLNRREMGGIAYPAVFAIDSNLAVRFRSLDGTARRAEPAVVQEIVKTVAGGVVSMPPQPELRKVRPGAMFLRALFNVIRRGARTSLGE